MNPKVVYRKTEAGVAEFQTRSLGLRAELRRLLILIDGTATLDRLAAFVRGTEIDFLVTELEHHGLITSTPIGTIPDIAPTSLTSPMGQGQPGIVAPTEGTARQPAESANAGIDGVLEPTAAQVLAVRRAAIQMLHEILGPDADTAAVKIERCKNSQEMRVAITEIRQMLDRQRGASLGQRFIDAVRGAAEGTR